MRRRLSVGIKLARLGAAVRPSVRRQLFIMRRPARPYTAVSTHPRLLLLLLLLLLVMRSSDGKIDCLILQVRGHLQTIDE